MGLLSAAERALQAQGRAFLTRFAERPSPRHRMLGPRTETAGAQGYDVDRVLYRGRLDDRAGYGGERPVPLHTDPRLASLYAKGEGGNVAPVVVRGRLLRVNEALQFADQAHYWLRRAKQEGYSGVEFTNILDRGTLRPQHQVWMVNGENIRSVHAKFSPERSASRNWLAGIGGGLAATAAAQDDWGGAMRVQGVL